MIVRAGIGANRPATTTAVGSHHANKLFSNPDLDVIRRSHDVVNLIACASDKVGYTSLEAANQALKACKELVERGGPASPVPQEWEAKFKAAQAKAKLSGVDTLTQEDIEGLSYEPIKELRGY